jgi:DNA-binding CsgD family transcriptional regulator
MEGGLLSTAQLRAFSEALERLYVPVPLEDFPRVLMEAVDGVVPCPSIIFNQVNLATGHAQWIGNMREGVLDNWAQHAHEHPGLAYVAAGGMKRVFALTDFVSQRQFRQTGLYEDVFKPLDVQEQLVAVLPTEDSATGISLNRDGGFSAGDKLLLELFQAHIVRARYNSQVLSAARQAKSTAPDFLSWRRLGLTRRECEILRWVTEGKRDNEIAVILKLSSRTINHHVGSILRKLDVENRTTAVRKALELLQ